MESNVTSISIKCIAGRLFVPIKGTATILILILLSCSLSCKQDKPLAYDNPESIVWNPVTSAYLISNAGSGQILTLKDKQDFSLFNQSTLTAPKGLAILNQTVYVTDVTQVVGYNLADGKEVWRYAVPGARFLNDIAASDSMLYISDMRANRIYSLQPTTKQLKTYADNRLISPNGLYFIQTEQGAKLYIVSYRSAAAVVQLDLSTEQFTSLPGTEVSMADGITRDNEGNWLISSWQDKSIHKYDRNWFKQTSLLGKVTSPADIYFNESAGELCIPLFESNQVNFVKLLSE